MGQHMPIGINNYINAIYRLFAKGLTEQGHTILVFSHPSSSSSLAQFVAKNECAAQKKGFYVFRQ